MIHLVIKYIPRMVSDIWIFYVFKHIPNFKLLLFSLSNRENYAIVCHYLLLNKKHVEKIQQGTKIKQKGIENLQHILQFSIENHKFVIPQLSRTLCNFPMNPHQFLKMGEFCKLHPSIVHLKIHDLYIHRQNEFWMYGCVVSYDNIKHDIVLFMKLKTLCNFTKKCDVKVAWYSLPYFDSFLETRQHFHSGGFEKPHGPCSALQAQELLGICYGFVYRS